MPSLENLASVALAAASLIVGGAVVHKEFIGTKVPSAPPSKVEFVQNWQRALSIGYRVGSPSAPITLVELVDLECPACARYQATVRQVVAEHPNDISVVYVPYPLSAIHRFALGAAKAAECANGVGRLSSWMDAVFKAQDSLGLVPWSHIALAAGIGDTAMITRCATDPRPVPRIQSGLAFAQSINAQGTPTILVNGWRFPDPPYLDQLDSAMTAIRRGARPPNASRSGN